ncbi:hypothetical protein [Ruminiclostridium cellobioparum]|uniref:Uncharacterized protein n=1 Tax=Ruminiclostridium cellobioparum subsp. termitidis CT1112 TaxID=1195236 RepID=S0FUI3_RUMCE|nr:hypothetical protein [Ruminiclostridium cellobioparum]EMS72193.1 hypothetical protein CTER_1916 [Ruminiclostridium cellobioparum subsp. termitidis CT1112]
MSRNYLTNIDLNKNELQNAVIQNLAIAPSNPKEGQIYYNTVDKTFYGWDGTEWEDLGAEGGTGGTYDYNELINKPFIPSKTSELTNDSDFVTRTTTDSLSTEIQNIKVALDEDSDGSIIDTIADIKAEWQAADSDLQTLVTQKTSKYTQVIGDGTITDFTITHNLNTLDAHVTVRENSVPYQVVIPDVYTVDANNIGVMFSVAPIANQYKVIIIG